MFGGSEGEVGSACLPVLGDLDVDGCDEAQDGGLVGEEGGDAGATLDFPVESLGHV